MDSPYSHITSEFARHSLTHLTYNHLISIPALLNLPLDHLPTLFCLDADLDGLFSESDITAFLSWQDDTRRTCLMHEDWPRRRAALCARRFAEAEAAAAWMKRLPDATLKAVFKEDLNFHDEKEKHRFCDSLVQDYKELVTSVFR